MRNKTKRIFLSFLIYSIFLPNALTTKKTYYIATEHPSVTYYNKKYASHVSFTARRYSRRDPMYYMSMSVETLVALDNNVTINYYAFPFPLNGPLLMEMHYKWCNMILKDEVIGALIRKYVPATCPTPKGIYKISNVTTASIPSVFVEHLPFTKARIYMNATIFNEKLVEGNMDIEVKRMKG